MRTTVAVEWSTVPGILGTAATNCGRGMKKHGTEYPLQKKFGHPNATGPWVLSGCSKFCQSGDEAEDETSVES